MNDSIENELYVDQYVEDYIKDLNNSSSAYDRSRAKTLYIHKNYITPEARQGLVKLVKNDWEYISIVYPTTSSYTLTNLVFLYRPTSMAIKLSPKGRIVGTVKIIPHETDLDFEGDWTKCDYSVDEFLSYYRQLNKISEDDRKAIEEL